MSKMNKSSTSKRRTGKKKEEKLTAAERRRLQRERERGEENRFSAFETFTDEKDKRKSLIADQNRFSNFEENPDGSDERDDYFDRLYGVTSNDSIERNSRSEGLKKKKSERERKKSDSEKTVKVKELTKRQRKTRTVLSYVGVFLVIVAIAAVFSLTVMFKTTEIIVNGENIPYSQEEIIETSGLKYSENIFLSRRKAAVKKLVEHYPYIEAAQITFRIPGTQIITIETAVPSYQVAVSEGFAVISAKGRVLEIFKEQKANIPLLKGLKLTDSREGQYISFEKNSTQQILNEVINNINENKVPNIYGIDISNSANIKLNYDNRITILLGVPEDVGYKLRTAMEIINDELAATDKGNLDVSLASSDRKSSYFTPIYSNTVEIDEDSSSTGSAMSENASTTIKSADEYLNDSAPDNSSQTEDYDYINDIIDENDYEYEETREQTEISAESRLPNINGNYGTQ